MVSPRGERERYCFFQFAYIYVQTLQPETMTESRRTLTPGENLLSLQGGRVNPLPDPLTKSRRRPAMMTSRTACRPMTLPKKSLGRMTTTLMSHSRPERVRASRARASDPTMNPKMATKRVTSRHLPLQSCQPHTDYEMRSNHPSPSSLLHRNALLPHRGLLEDSDHFRPLGSDPA